MSAESRLAVADSDEDEDDLLMESGTPSKAISNSHSQDRDVFNDDRPKLKPEVEVVLAQATSSTPTTVHMSRPQHESTGSTERLQKDIRRAEQRLLEATPSQASINPSIRCLSTTKSHSSNAMLMDAPLMTQSLPHAAAVPPQLMPSGRRHTLHYDESNVFVDHHMLNSVRRSASLRTVDHPQSLQLPRSTERTSSYTHELPNGLYGDDFVLHEPALLFRDTGSTTVCDESSQADRLHPSAVQRSKSTEMINGSTTPNDAALVHSPGRYNGNGVSPADASTSLIWTPSGVLPTPLVTSENSERKSNNTLSPERSPAHEHQSADANQSIVVTTEPPKRCSPIVQIPAQSPTHADTESIAARPVKEQSKRSRQPEQTSPDSVWEDRNYGLPPPDQYKPRPSKRRATVVANDSVDNAVVLGKASRIRRNKTAIDRTTDETSSILKPSDAATPESTDQASKQDIVEQDVNVALPTAASPPKNAASDKPIIVSPAKQEANTSSSMAPPSLARGPIHVAISTSEHDFSVSPTPPRRARRSHTTIYEDHPQYQSTSKSLSLTEQQKKRKRNVLNKSETTESPLSRSKLRKIAIADSDDEDELALEAASDQSDVEIVQVVKSAAEKSNKASRAKRLDAKAVVEEPPVKAKKRGRPRKEAPVEAHEADRVDEVDELTKDPAIHETGKVDQANHDIESTTLSSSRVESDRVEHAAVDIKNTGQHADEHRTTALQAHPEEPATHDPAPSESPPLPSAQGPTGPTHHSPLRATSPVPYRVGLSRRQRIPSLLRVVRPATAPDAATTSGKKGSKRAT